MLISKAHSAVTRRTQNTGRKDLYHVFVSVQYCLRSSANLSGTMQPEFTEWFRPPQTLAEVMQELQSHIPRDLADASGSAASLNPSPTRAASFPFQRAVAYTGPCFPLPTKTE
jgi:hypothetical protein